jgi:hypothetical protein
MSAIVFIGSVISTDKAVIIMIQNSADNIATLEADFNISM